MKRVRLPHYEIRIHGADQDETIATYKTLEQAENAKNTYNSFPGTTSKAWIQK